MKLTNKLNLPASIVAAVANDPYRGGGDISVTKLIAPPYQRQLLRGMGDALTEDVADRIWSLMGQIGHSIVERMPLEKSTAIAEERLYMDVFIDGRDMPVLVSGQFDLIESGVLTDFKFTSVYSRDGKLEWEQQLNLLSVLCAARYKQTGDIRYFIRKLQVIAVFRDWQKAKVGIGDYPESQVAVIPVDLWPVERALAFMTERVALHYAAFPQPCTDEERWATDDVYALMKKGRKTAVKLYRNEDAANEVAKEKGSDHVVIHRPREYKRCSGYCSAASICPTWQEFIKQAPF